MKFTIAILYVVTVSYMPTFSQNLQTEINEQVWKPFIQSFNECNAEEFLAVHSKDVIRSPRDSKRIYDWSTYLANQTRGDQRSKSEGIKRSIELRFTERIADKNFGIDVGIYKTTETDAKGQSNDYYGRFHVVLRKENGKWKILVDTDSSEGGTIGKEQFLAAKPL